MKGAASGFLNGLAGGIESRKEREDEKRAAAQRESAQTRADQGVTGTPRREQRPPARPPSLDSSEVDPNLASGIRESAAALGIDPADLATAISYETAGTFSPIQRGPTTKWGQHRGLIQFGEPQAERYGVDWNDPVASQLGRNGAIVKYLRDAGVRPGMGMLDIYSAINAGSVGRYDASDAAAGGAPGSVRDKVQNQMAGHRAKAEALLGAYPKQPPAGPHPPMRSVIGPRMANRDSRPDTWAWHRGRSAG